MERSLQEVALPNHTDHGSRGDPTPPRDGSWLAKNSLSQRFLAEQGIVTLAPDEADGIALSETCDLPSY
jgi:hypothetical protein